MNKLLLVAGVLLLSGCNAPLDLEQARDVLDNGCKKNGGLAWVDVFQSSSKTYLQHFTCKDGAIFRVARDWRSDQ